MKYRDTYREPSGQLQARRKSEAEEKQGTPGKRQNGHHEWDPFGGLQGCKHILQSLFITCILEP